MRVESKSQKRENREDKIEGRMEARKRGRG